MTAASPPIIRPFPEGGVARVHFIIGRSGGKTPRVPQAKLEEAIRDIATRWIDRFETCSPATRPSKICVDKAYPGSLHAGRSRWPISPISLACAAGEPIRIAFYHAGRARAGILSLKIFHAGEPAVAVAPRAASGKSRLQRHQRTDLRHRRAGCRGRPAPRRAARHGTRGHRDGRVLDLDTLRRRCWRRPSSPPSTA